MAGYWPRSFFASLWTSASSRAINKQEKNLANIQPSWPNKLGQQPICKLYPAVTSTDICWGIRNVKSLTKGFYNMRCFVMFVTAVCTWNGRRKAFKDHFGTLKLARLFTESQKQSENWKICRLLYNEKASSLYNKRQILVASKGAFFRSPKSQHAHREDPGNEGVSLAVGGKSPNVTHLSRQWHCSSTGDFRFWNEPWSFENLPGS